MTRAAPTLLAAYAIALAAGVLSLWVSGAWTSGFSGADEPAHFLNSWFVSSYLKDALGQHPLAFATEYYLHYPKISIGHWPPAYYGLVAPVFWVAPATPQTAMAVNLLLAALPAVGVAALLLRLHGRAAALVGALLWAATPLALEGQAFFMLDQPLAACAVFAALAWVRFAERQAWVDILPFAGLTALAILIKGKGWLLVLCAAFHIALAGRWELLRSPKLWAGAAAGLVPVVPWYLATAGISADGFNYQPGLAYAALSLTRNVEALGANTSLIGPGLALAGAIVLWRHRKDAAERWNVGAACLALVLATLALQALVPVDLDPRYITPALPGLVVLAVAGALALSRIVTRRPHWAAVPLLLTMAPGAAHLAAREPKVNLRMEEAAALAGSGSASEAWLIDGGSGAEGAFVAAMAVRDPGLTRYTVRASKLLATSDFMGNRYTLRFTEPQAAAAEMRRLGLSGVVVAERPGVEEFAHRPLLAAVLADPASGYRLVAELAHVGRPGTTRIYRSVPPVVADVEAIRALGVPDKAKAVAGQ